MCNDIFDLLMANINTIPFHNVLDTYHASTQLNPNTQASTITNSYIVHVEPITNVYEALVDLITTSPKYFTTDTYFISKFIRFSFLVANLNTTWTNNDYGSEEENASLTYI